MPFTPFHFGPGLFAKSLASRHFSWGAFVVSQVIIDIETLHYMLQRTYPIHRFLHTFLGATIAGLLIGAVLIGLKSFVRRVTPPASNRLKRYGASAKAEFSTVGLLVGSLVGGVTHPFLDGIMHRDVRPLAPWSDANPLLGLVGLGTLHLGCLVLGVVGMIVVTIRLHRESLANNALPTRSAGDGGI